MARPEYDTPTVSGWELAAGLHAHTWDEPSRANISTLGLHAPNPTLSLDVTGAGREPAAADFRP